MEDVRGSEQHQNEWDRAASFTNLNTLIYSRSKRAQLVVMNLPTYWGTDDDDSVRFVGFCETLIRGLDRVLFVHSSDTEVFQLGT